MKSNHKVSLLCCVLIVVATEIQCSTSDGVLLSSAHMKFPKESKLTVGSGSKPDYLPVIEYTEDVDPDSVLRCTAHTRSHDKCNFTLRGSKGTDRGSAIVRAYQFSDTKLAVAWIEDVDKNPKIYDPQARVTFVDLTNCSTKDILYSKSGGQVEFYPDSFELLTEGYGRNSSRRIFDVNGTQIGESTLPADPGFFQVFPASTKSPSKNFFIYISNYTIHTMSLEYVDGKEIKSIVNVGKQRERLHSVSHADESSRAICWVNQLDLEGSQLCECAQFDELGNELWRNGTRCDGVRPAGVRNLKGGGVMLLLRIREKNELHIVEMRPGQETLMSVVKTLDEPAYYKEKPWQVVDFNEADRTFSLYWVVSPYLTETYTDLAFAKFSFPSKAHE